jgi:hypothetical protein
MSLTVCLFANTISYPEGGGHLWAYLNWALGLRALGCRVIWLEGVDFGPGTSAESRRSRISGLKQRLARYGLAEHVALWSWSGQALPRGAGEFLDLEAAAQADLLLNVEYFAPAEVVGRFRRSALLDIDPGLLQLWVSEGSIRLARHDVYFTIGETVGRPGARFPDAGLRWCYTPPAVALDWWPVHPAPEGAPFTTVTHWSGRDYVGDEQSGYPNDKRAGFLPFLDLPRLTGQPLELAVYLADDEADERALLHSLGWRISDPTRVASTPWDYQRYIQASRGEFSCAKPSCVRLENAWVSDRTLCYLASGKPAVVQHTGPSRFLPDAAGVFRFRDLAEAVRGLEAAAANHERQAGLARALAEEYFDARKVAGALLERALG